MFSGAETLMQFSKGIIGNIHVKLLSIGPVVQEMSFKDISYQELWGPSCSVERNHLCNLF